MISKLILGAGCFWGVEVLFEEMSGVKKVISGYAGGHTENPTYEEVCTGKSGHIEVVEIEYDNSCLLYTSPSPRDRQKSRMPSSA